MSDDDNNYRSPKQALLGELESIKSLLDKSSSGEFDESLSDELLDIPILDDVVPELSNNTQTSGLLDLDNIFDDLDDDGSASPLIDENTLHKQPAAQATTESTQPIHEQHNEQQIEPEQEQAQEASLQLDHLDANISFPAFTLDADDQENSPEVGDQPQPEQASTLEGQSPNSILLQNNDDSAAINTTLQQDLAACLDDNTLSQPAAPLLTDLHSADDISHDDNPNDDSHTFLPTTGHQTEPHLDWDEADSIPLEDKISNLSASFSKTPPAASNATSPSPDSDLDLDLMIQELVDEFIPPIEAELRKRLSKCSPAVIAQLAKKHLDN